MSAKLLLDISSTFISSTLSTIAEPVDEFLWLVVVGGFVCFAMAWGIGANDVANAFATSVGSGAVSIKQAVVIAAIFEFLGAFALGANVTNTIRKKITDYSLYEGEGDILMLGMFCSLCSAALWLFLATKYQLPVSTTQSIVGAIVGFVLASKGVEGVVWENIIYIAAFWVISPIAAALGSCVLFIPTRRWLFRRQDSYEKTLLTWPLWIFIVVFVMSLFLMLKGLKRLDFEFTFARASWIAVICATCAAVIAYFVFIKTGCVDRFVRKSLENQKLALQKKASNIVPTDEYHETNEIPMETMHAAEETDDSEESMDDIDIKGINMDDIDIKDENEITPKSPSKIVLLARQATYGMNVDIREDVGDLEDAIHEKSEKFDPKTEKAFAWPQVCTATLDIFAHGSNDVANAVAPFAAIVSIYETQSISSKAQVEWWILFIGAFGMTIGLATYGYKIMQCLGVRMGAMSSTRGYCIELSSAMVVIVASYYGFPASTTHAQVGATVGVGLCELGAKNSKLKWQTVINWKLLAQVWLSWVLTLFISGITCAVLFSFMAYSPYAGDVCRD